MRFNQTIRGLTTLGGTDDVRLLLEKKFSHARANQLQELVEKSPEAWNRLVAIASLLAEHKRAEILGCDVNWSAALANFEPDHWQWESADEWTSQMRVHFI